MSFGSLFWGLIGALIENSWVSMKKGLHLAKGLRLQKFNAVVAVGDLLAEYKHIE